MAGDDADISAGFDYYQSAIRHERRGVASQEPAESDVARLPWKKLDERLATRRAAIPWQSMHFLRVLLFGFPSMHEGAWLARRDRQIRRRPRKQLTCFAIL